MAMNSVRGASRFGMSLIICSLLHESEFQTSLVFFLSKEECEWVCERLLRASDARFDFILTSIEKREEREREKARKREEKKGSSLLLADNGPCNAIQFQVT